MATILGPILAVGNALADFWSPSYLLTPSAWSAMSLCCWMLYVGVRGWGRLGVWDRRQFVWGVFSSLVFLHYVNGENSIKGWGDVYYFCGENLDHCTCTFRWNLLGWHKALVLWSFVLSAALGLQRLCIQLGLNGLLPGEEVVTKESFISICWRLIPYWLNNWEQQWGAECSSMMFELPHFAVELLVVLPCVQILCSRMKVLALPQVNVLLPEGQDTQEFIREHFAPNILRGYWERNVSHKTLWNRLRGNLRIMAFTAFITALAAGNALVVPLYLERQILSHPLSAMTSAVGARASEVALMENQEGISGEGEPWQEAYLNRMNAYFSQGKECGDVEQLRSNFAKHAEEIHKMGDPEHINLIPLVESALAIMRLSCEKFFVLLTVFVSYLLFREPPAAARYLIRLNSKLSSTFQRVILYSFPAVCWIYGAGFIFSTFVSVVFWGGPVIHMYENIKSSICSVQVKSLRLATVEEVERMGGNCAICWGEMTPGVEGPTESGEQAEGPGSSAQGHSLRCGHSYHRACLSQWLNQCHVQGMAATCPMCQQTIQMEVKWRVPFFSRGSSGEGLQAPGDADGAPLDHQQELQELLRDMPQILGVAAAENLQLQHEVQALQEQRARLLRELQRRRQELEEVQGQRDLLQQEGQLLQLQHQQLLAELVQLERQREQQRQEEMREQAMNSMLEMDGAEEQGGSGDCMDGGCLSMTDSCLAGVGSSREEGEMSVTS